jgi:hypothetical protein
MSHPSSQVEVIDGISVHARSFKTNLLFYKSIGGKVEVRSATKSRRWWCLWLCKKRNNAKANLITIESLYYSRFERTAVLVTTAQHATNCINASDCKLTHSAVGAVAEITFPSGSTTPRTLPTLLPLHGVISRATITIAGRTIVMETAAGDHPG